MKIDSTNEIASALLELSQTHDSVDITEVSTIIGTSCEMINIINSDKIIGFNTVDLVVTDPIDSDRLSILESNTTGTIERAGE